MAKSTANEAGKLHNQPASPLQILLSPACSYVPCTRDGCDNRWRPWRAQRTSCCGRVRGIKWTTRPPCGQAIAAHPCRLDVRRPWQAGDDGVQCVHTCMILLEQRECEREFVTVHTGPYYADLCATAPRVAVRAVYHGQWLVNSKGSNGAGAR